ncbi:TonB-dependent receptor [Bacteroidia bacterium]|nr:TonB-dependent receptor [Bacteroidia bacterium]
MNKALLILFVLFTTSAFKAANVRGVVQNNAQNLSFVKVKLDSRTTYTDTAGRFEFNNVDTGNYNLTLKLVGYDMLFQRLSVLGEDIDLEISMLPSAKLMNKVVVSGNLKEVSKSKSPVPIDIISAEYLQANPAPSVFEALQTVNGVRPQNNCNVCNTGDIHINGLEGAYTMILIDGMPIVGGLSTIYGLNGIPQSLIERVEIVKGPASTLFGSEAVGGIINVITKNPYNTAKLAVDYMHSSWNESNLDVAYKTALGEKVDMLVSANYYNYDNPIDKNGDGFTDLTIQNRVSLFSKMLLKRKSNKLFSLAARYNSEKRWGGEMDWETQFRGGDSIYGESIYTNRWEAFGVYELPTQFNLKLQCSSNYHKQNSYYGNVGFFADQFVQFGQLIHEERIGKNTELLAGVTYRYTFYDDNTIATQEQDTIHNNNQPSITHLPGAFIQTQHYIKENKIILTGLRYDYNSIHGHILTPRVNYKWNSANKRTIFRISAGNGYRVANVFTEDHAALTGARKVVFKSKLKPEKSWNGNVNMEKKLIIGKDKLLNIDASTWYTYFTNKIIPDYLTNPNQIIYDNLAGYAVSQGVSLNLDLITSGGFGANIGATVMDVSQFDNGEKTRQLLTEQLSGVWKISYEMPRFKLLIDYTGNVYSPMKLPRLGSLDQRSANSPWYSLQNIKVTKTFKSFTLYGGVKNLLNFTPSSLSIARSFDPFDKQVQFDANGNAIPTVNNPQALTFDPSYVYASNQGRRFYIGLSYKWLK